MRQLPNEANGVEERLVKFSIRSSMAFAAATVVTYVADGSLNVVYAIGCTITFVVGVALFALGMWNGIQRSRVDDVTLTGLVAIDASHVPKATRNALWLAVLIQVVVSILFASLRPFTQQAFGLLVPVLGLGIATLWGSRFASFHARVDP